MPEHEADEALTELHAAAIRTLAEVHDTFLQFLRRNLRNDSDAEDVMAEFNLRVVTHASQLRKEESVQIWLRRLLQSALSDWRRRAAARARAEADFARKEAAAPSETGYAAVKPMFDRSCIACHNPSSGLQIPSLATFQDVQKLTRVDTGQSILQLARVSHIHLFGISIIFLLTGVVFSLSETPVWLRISLVVVPYLAILADISSWWFTKFTPVFFGYVVVIGGAIWGLALAAQILISLWEMWLPVPWSRAGVGAVWK